MNKAIASFFIIIFGIAGVFGIIFNEIEGGLALLLITFIIMASNRFLKESQEDPQ